MRIPVELVTRATIVIGLALTIGHLFPEFVSYAVHIRLDLDQEATIPAWYTSTLLISVALAALGIHALDPGTTDTSSSNDGGRPDSGSCSVSCSHFCP